MQNQRISLEGNNGGDIFELELLPNGRLKLEVDHCCVKTINHIVPVEFLTAVLSQAIINAGGVEGAMQSIQWPPDYVDSLMSKIKDISIAACKTRKKNKHGAAL